MAAAMKSSISSRPTLCAEAIKPGRREHSLEIGRVSAWKPPEWHPGVRSVRLLAGSFGVRRVGDGPKGPPGKAAAGRIACPTTNAENRARAKHERPSPSYR